MRLLLWVFIGLVTIADVGFAYVERHTLTSWEINPVARLVYAAGGLPAITAYRLGWSGFALVMSQARTRLAPLVLPVWLLGHLYLALLLILALLALR